MRDDFEVFLRRHRDDRDAMGEHGEKRVLIRHIREQHPNLLGAGPGAGGGFGSPLPAAGISDLPFAYINMVHQAAHIGLWGGAHTDDDWLCKHLRKGVDD
jgi:hypothetical protein